MIRQELVFYYRINRHENKVVLLEWMNEQAGKKEKMNLVLDGCLKY